MATSKPRIEPHPSTEPPKARPRETMRPITSGGVYDAETGRQLEPPTAPEKPKEDA